MFALLLFSSYSWGQGKWNMVTLSGGYAFTNLEDTDVDATGWKIGGTYEYNPMGNFANGMNFGYIQTKATAQNLIGDDVNYTINSFPVYYSPKYLFGGESFKGFVKGSLGMHFSNYKQIGPALSVESKFSGFYGGAGAGVTKTLGDTIYLNLEYEWAFMSNAYDIYRNGFMNTIVLGVGAQF